jgi:quercetin dioxygenase-like cupin family protein
VQKDSLTALARTQLQAALSAHSGRSAKTVFGGHEHVLRQTMIALRAGEKLEEHDSPGDATVQVLHGRVVLAAGADSWVGAMGAMGAMGDLLRVPAVRHSLHAAHDSVVLLTVAKRIL